MIIGLILGLFIGILLAMIGGALLNIITDNETIAIISALLIFVICITLCTYLSIYFDKLEYEKQVNTYIVTKQTIEDAIQNKDITGLEKLELLKQVNEQNEKLERLKVEVKQWYCFYLDRTKVENLEPIELK